MSTDKALYDAANAVSSQGVGGPEHVGTQCLVAYAAGYTPYQILEAARKTVTKSGKEAQIRTHKKLVWGSYALHILGAEHFVDRRKNPITGEWEDVEETVKPMTIALRWATIDNVEVVVPSILSKDEDAATRAGELRLRWQQKMEDKAAKAKAKKEADESITSVLVKAQSEVESLLGMVDSGRVLSDEEHSLAGSIFEMLSTIVGVKVGANA